ncbi:hypothetical protein GCM10027601_10860 [Nocardioides ungokensis]
MFHVDNADFIADKLAAELLPNQEYREAAKNSAEAIARRLASRGGPKGRVEYDVDWAILSETEPPAWYLSCADNGDGMTRHELGVYTTTLAVRGANQNQSLTGNQGMGLKISGPTRHKEGLLIRSLKAGEASMVQVGWNKQTKQYGLIPLGDGGEEIVSVPMEFFPDFILGSGSGTVVTFLGNAAGENTFVPAGNPRGWLFKYLNQRFFRFEDEGIEMLVRVPTGEVEDWPTSREEAVERTKGKGRSFNLSRVNGTAAVWDDASRKLGDHYSGTVTVAGDHAAGQPAANVHWWVLPTGPGSDVSTRTFSGGSIGILYQNEVHDWRTSSLANAYFARFGVLLGKNRVGFVVEPLGDTVTSDFARAHVLVGGKPVFEHEAWVTWAEQFRSSMPPEIREVMAEEQERMQIEDPDRNKRIKERLKDVMSLLRPVRARRRADGSVKATGPTVSGGTTGTKSNGTSTSSSPSSTTRKSSGARGIGSLLSQLSDAGESADLVYSSLELEPVWRTEEEASSYALVGGDVRGLHDRAAALAGEDGATAPLLILNKQFRGYTAIVEAVNEWANPEGDETKAEVIETQTQEWITQKMLEAVSGLRQLENGSSWTAQTFNEGLSPVALTGAFMADRYHTLREVKRHVGSLRQSTPASIGTPAAS